MDQVITFDKSLQKRLQEYNDVLSGYEVLPASGVLKEWSFYLELTLDPDGWQAVWKIQRKTCEALGIPFPSVVLVFVLSIDVKDLTALVRILAVQDDICIPERHSVSLIHLWPTKDQDRTIALNLDSTANVLDMLRFFYLYVFMPWDNEEDDTTDWKSKHLESRLRLYYDMKNGVIPRPVAEHLHSLLMEAKHLQTKREQLEADLADSDEDYDEADVNNANVMALMELHIRMLEIKNEVDILENPLFRNVIVKRRLCEAEKKDVRTQNVWLILHEGMVDEYIHFLEKVKLLYPDKIVRFPAPLSESLDIANPDDVYLLNESNHVIKTTGALETGGTLKGLFDKGKTILTTKADDVMLDIKGDCLLEHITFDATSPQCAIIVRRGTLTMNDCRIIGDGISSTHQGFIVLAGANLELINCDVTKFYTAIVGNSGASITIKNSEIYDSTVGIKIYDNCMFKAQNTTIRNCIEYGICVETENNFDGTRKVGDFASLNIMPQLKLEFVSGQNNAKGDAVINKKSEIRPIEDLFGNPDLDPTICQSSDEMDVNDEDNLNVTVIEKHSYGNVSPATV